MTYSVKKTLNGVLQNTSPLRVNLSTKLRNKMGDSLLDDCLVTYIERDIFFEVDEDEIKETFMSLRRRKPDKSKK